MVIENSIFWGLQILKEFPALRDDRLIISYAKKAISINVSSTPRERRLSISASRAKQKKATTPVKTNFVQSFGNFQREARKAFSWVPRDSGTKTPPKDTPRKRKSLGSGGDRSSWDAMPGVQEERTPVYPSELQDRLPFVSAPDEWVLTGDPDKDDATRSSHRYETSPDITLFKVCLLFHICKVLGFYALPMLLFFISLICVSLNYLKLSFLLGSMDLTN